MFFCNKSKSLKLYIPWGPKTCKSITKETVQILNSDFLKECKFIDKHDVKVKTQLNT
jgi:hypothetical protein